MLLHLGSRAFFCSGEVDFYGWCGGVEVVAFWGWSPLRFWGWDGGGIVTFRGLVVAYCGVGGQVFFWSLRFFVGRGVVTIFDPFFWGGVRWRVITFGTLFYCLQSATDPGL